MAAAVALRIWLDAGHGLGNFRPGRFDTGATSCYGSEHEIAYRLVDLVADQFYREPPFDVTVVETPSCSSECVALHPRRSHLAYRIDFINDNLKRRPNGRPIGEVLLSVHLNSAQDDSATGVEVLYSPTAPLIRKEIAAKISAAVAAKLSLRDRGAKTDSQAKGKQVALIRRVDCAAYLLEIGFVTNPADVEAIRACGYEALLAAIETIVKEHQ